MIAWSNWYVMDNIDHAVDKYGLYSLPTKVLSSKDNYFFVLAEYDDHIVLVDLLARKPVGNFPTKEAAMLAAELIGRR